MNKPKKCKQCKVSFIPIRRLQMVCSPKCAIAYASKKQAEKIKKEIDKKVSDMKPYAKERGHKKYFQDEINLLARKIDSKFGHDTCICCARKLDKQIHGAHRHSVGSNSTLRYNLHNIHSATSHCNQHSNTHISGYKVGLALRYGYKYAFMVEDLPLTYKTIKLTALEIVEKLKLVRKINRTFDTYVFESAIDARENLNNLIGIYRG